MKRCIILGLLLIGSTFAADSPKPSASMSAAQNIRGQVAVMVAEVEDALLRDGAVLLNLGVLESEVGAVAKTVAKLSERVSAMVEDQQLRVNAMAAKRQALTEELAAIDRIIAKLEMEVKP